MSQASYLTYSHFYGSPKKGEVFHKILSEFSDSIYPLNISYLRDKTNIKHQTLTGALNVLLDNGIIYETGEKVKIKNAWYTDYLLAENEEVSYKKAEERRVKKFKKWIKMGNKNFLDLMPFELREFVTNNNK